MKRLVLLFFGMISIGATAQNVTIPDVNFKNALLADVSINTNSDGEISIAEAANFTGQLYLGNNNISDLTGIEAFTSISYLDVSSNNLTSLDLHLNTNLGNVVCSYNSISTLNLTGLSSLYNLECQYNQLSSLVLVSNTYLMALNCSNNLINELGLNNCNLLYFLDCSSNYLTELNVRNGNNTNVSEFNATNNPFLACITVDDVSYSTQNWTNIDANTSFSTGCTGTYVFIPDPNFKAALVNDATINNDQDLNISFSEAANATTIHATNKGIYDLTGLEAFTNLLFLYADSNHLTRANIAANPNLILFKVASNSIQNLDFSNNSQLIRVDVQHNFLSFLDLSNLSNLQFFFGMNNSFSSIDLTNNTSLIGLSCSGTFSTLDLSQNTQLDSLAIWTYSLASLDLSNNTALKYLYMPYCNTYSVDLSHCNNLIKVDIFNNQLTDLDLSNRSYLQELNCQSNLLQTINLNGSDQLKKIDCSANQLTQLDFSNFPLLEKLDCHSNSLTELNVQNGNNPAITYFDASINSSLSCIQVDNPAFSYAAWATGIDGTTSFSTSCLSSCDQYISGYITDGGLGNFPVLGISDTILVRLLAVEDQDSLAWDTVDVFQITLPNDSAFYQFGPISEGNYVIHATYTSAVAGENYIPTFSGNTYLYQQADTIQVNTCDSLSYSIDLINPNLQNGDGALSGFIYFYNFLLGKTESNDPIPLIDVVIEKDSTPSGHYLPVRYEEANLVAGFNNLYFYHSDSLPMGTYRIQVVVAGIPQVGNYSPVLTIVNDSIPHLNFCADSFSLGVITICDFDTVSGLVVGIGSEHEEPGVLAPNPNNGNFNLIWQGIEQAGTLEISDLHGKLIYRTSVAENEFKNGKNYHINSLYPGIYQVQLRSGNRYKVQKMVVLEME
ncbi:MAG: T9SS type A sorting domain-containing protein [Bacteroidia bacterium]|nr:T9SS type A sorting domain-containing protein [Bacteroidia bacterium]